MTKNERDKWFDVFVIGFIVGTVTMMIVTAVIYLVV